ncbi:hypothetical protein BKA93DRAFT_751682 [Sparassis latifolia]
MFRLPVDQELLQCDSATSTIRAVRVGLKCLALIVTAVLRAQDPVHSRTSRLYTHSRRQNDPHTFTHQVRNRCSVYNVRGFKNPAGAKTSRTALRTRSKNVCKLWYRRKLKEIFGGASVHQDAPSRFVLIQRGIAGRRTPRPCARSPPSRADSASAHTDRASARPNALELCSCRLKLNGKDTWPRTQIQTQISFFIMLRPATYSPNRITRSLTQIFQTRAQRTATGPGASSCPNPSSSTNPQRLSVERPRCHNASTESTPSKRKCGFIRCASVGGVTVTGPRETVDSRPVLMGSRACSLFLKVSKVRPPRSRGLAAKLSSVHSIIWRVHAGKVSRSFVNCHEKLRKFIYLFISAFASASYHTRFSITEKFEWGCAFAFPVQPTTDILDNLAHSTVRARPHPLAKPREDPRAIAITGTML